MTSSPNIISSAANRAAVAYYGLQENFLERRLDGTENRRDKAERSEAVYRDLGRTATDFISDTGDSMPPPPTTQRGLSAQAASQDRIDVLRRRARGETVPDPPAPPTPSFDPDPALAPQNRKERRAHRKTAARLHEINDSAIDQKKARNMFGETGLHLRFRTKFAARREKKDAKREFKEGTINALELQQRKRGAKANSVRSSYKDPSTGDRIVAPSSGTLVGMWGKGNSMINTAKRIDKLSEGVPDKLGSKATRASKKQQKYERRRVKIDRKLQTVRTKRAAARARL